MTIMETENKEKFIARTMYHKLKHLRCKQTKKNPIVFRTHYSRHKRRKTSMDNRQ